MLLFLSVATSLFSAAWSFGFIGHKLSTALLWDLLPPEFRHGCLGFPTTSSNRINKLNFMRLACRPDRIKHRPGMEWAQPLHFFNTKDHPPVYCQTYKDFMLGSEDGPNLVQAARNYTQALDEQIRRNQDKPLNYDQQAQILSFMVHFLTDLHQPLHVSARRNGGNKIWVKFEGKRRSLHSLWDTHLLAKFVNDRSRWQAKRALAKSVTMVRKRKRDSLSQLDCIAYWAAETNRMNCEVVWNFDRYCDLGGSYYRKSIPVVLELVALSAVRTLRLLETMCPSSSEFM